MNITSKARRELEELISLHVDEDDIAAWIKKNCNPEEVFDLSVLEEWATDNGFVRRE